MLIYGPRQLNPSKSPLLRSGCNLNCYWEMKNVNGVMIVVIRCITRFKFNAKVEIRRVSRLSYPLSIRYIIHYWFFDDVVSVSVFVTLQKDQHIMAVRDKGEYYSSQDLAVKQTGG